MGFVWHFQDTRPIETDLDYLEVFRKLGLRVLQLTYNTQNYVGSGCCELHDAGLSSFGREVVKECNRLGLLIDLSHCGYATCWDAIRHTRKPVALTHVGAYALCPATGRNKPDEILQGRRRHGWRHRDRLLRSPGQAQQCDPRGPAGRRGRRHRPHRPRGQAGGKRPCGDRVRPQQLLRTDPRPPPFSSIRSYRPLRPDVFGVGPVDRYDPWPVGLDSHSKMMNLTRGLVKRGYSDADVLKILGGNWLRLFRETW